MKTLNGLALTTAFVLVSSVVLAGPLQRTDVPPELAWVLHVDCDALRSTALGEYLSNEMDKPEAEARFAVFKTIYNFDPRSAMHGLTLYAIPASPRAGIALVYADVDTARLETLVRGAHDYHSSTYRSHTIHNWIDERRLGKPRTFAAIHAGRVVVFGQTETGVSRALDVLDRNAPNLASGAAFPEMGARSGAIVQAAATKLDLTEDPNAAIFRMSKEIHFRMDEPSRQVNAVLTLKTEGAEVAGHVASIAQGLVSLMKLQTEKPESVKIAHALTITTVDSEVTATLKLAASDMIEVFKTGVARKLGQNSNP